jgi:hypothetical protein
MNTPTDIERIKRDIPIDSLIAQSFTVIGNGHTLTTAEHDSLKIFTNNNTWTWYSQAGRNGKSLGGSVIDWYMHVNKCSNGEAIRALSAMLDGGAVPAMPKPVVEKQPAKPPPGWKSAQWQQDARRELEDYHGAQDTLWNLPEGQPGRDYLTTRGIRQDMWVAFDLGYGEVWNNRAGRTMPALWIPWRNRQLTAIQYRFLVDKDYPTADRYGQRKGGTRYLFGLQHCMDADPGQLHTLFLLEGELNAISVIQCVYGQYPCDVISYGPQSNITNEDVAEMAAKVAKRYRRVIVWADEPAAAQKAIGVLPDTIKVLPVRSPTRDGNKHDANYLLQHGQLDDVVYKLIRTVTA